MKNCFKDWSQSRSEVCWWQRLGHLLVCDLRQVQQCERSIKRLLVLSLHCWMLASACSIKMAAPCNLQIKCIHWLESKAKHLSTCSLNCFISYIHTKKQTLSFRKSNLKLLRAKSLTKTHYYHGSHLVIWGETPIELNRERLQGLWRALAFREKALSEVWHSRRAKTRLADHWKILGPGYQ